MIWMDDQAQTQYYPSNNQQIKNKNKNWASLAIVVNSYVGRSVQGYLINVSVADICTEYGRPGVFIRYLKLLYKKNLDEHYLRPRKLK